jgi:putative ABC transport system permease protein
MRMTTPRVAFRNLTRNGRRFLFLGAAVCATFFFIFSVQSLLAGFYSQINARGARFYGGHVIISRRADAADVTSAHGDGPIMAAVANAGVHPEVVSLRSHFYNDGVLFFNGESVRIRRVSGVDWSSEGRKLSEMFVQGNLSGMSDKNWVLISDVTAQRLRAQVGDRIVLQVSRDGGSLDTAALWVKAIFREASIFGYYTVYMDRGVLDQALGLNPSYAASVGIYLGDYAGADRAATSIAKLLGPDYTVTSVIDLLAEIRTMLRALTIISYGILALLSVVAAVGILNMYRVIIYERTREIGTMRAIGIQRAQVRNIILWEAGLLAVCGVVAGFVASAIVLFAVSRIPLSAAAGFDIFLDRGRLSWVLRPATATMDTLVMIGMTILGALSPARSAQAVQAVVALRAE